MSRQIELIEKGIGELFKRELAYERALIRLAKAEHAYRLRRAVTFLQADGTDKTRTHLSEVECGAEMNERLTSQAMVDALKAKIDDARTVISARKQILEAEARLTGQP